MSYTQNNYFHMQNSFSTTPHGLVYTMQVVAMFWSQLIESTHRKTMVLASSSITQERLHHFDVLLLGRHGSDSLCRDERENKMAATYNVLAFKR